MILIMSLFSYACEKTKFGFDKAEFRPDVSYADSDSLKKKAEEVRNRFATRMV